MKKALFLSMIILGGVLYAFCPRSYQFNAQKVQEYITEHSHARSRGLCALYVRKALEAGGCCTWGHPMSAKEYDKFLPYLDFSKIDRTDYHPQLGDIVVFEAASGHPYGHIAIWNGKQWVSDFRQKNLFVAQAYRKANNYHYYRMKKDHPKRRFTLSQHCIALGIGPLEAIANKIQKIR